MKYVPVLALALSVLLVSLAGAAGTDLTLFGPKRYDRLQGRPTVYTDTFEGCTTSGAEFFLRVTNGDSKKTRITSARIYVNGTKVAAERDFKRRVPSFEKTISAGQSNSLKIVLKSGRHGYFDKLARYRARQADLERSLDRLNDLKALLTGPVLDRKRLSHLAAEIKHILESATDHQDELDRISRSLDDDEDDDGSSSDDGQALDTAWVHEQKEGLERRREEVRDAIKQCEAAAESLERGPPEKEKHHGGKDREKRSDSKDDDHDADKQAIRDLALLLKKLDSAIADTVARLTDLEDKIEKLLARGPSFLVIEIIGRGCDSTAPVISNPLPQDGALLNTPSPLISADYSDEPNGSGIDAATARLTVDGTDVTASASASSAGIGYSPPALGDGVHTVVVSVSDRAKNAASLSWSFTTDTTAPAVSITSHTNDQYVNTPTIALSGTIDDSSASVLVNGRPAEVSGTGFSIADLALTEGQNTVLVEATDPAGNRSATSIVINLDTAPPVVSITTPGPGVWLNTPQIAVSGTLNEEVLSVNVNGVQASVSGTSFSADNITLTEGENTITVEATDRAGNTGTGSLVVTLDTRAPAIQVTTPLEKSFLNTPQISVSGSVDEPVTTITVNSTPAQMTGNSFTLAGVSLAEGANTITVEATDRAGNRGTVALPVTLDTIAPVISIAAPVQGSFVNTPSITVSGTVADANPAGLWVNGNSVPLANNGFSLADLPLVEGSNTITVRAADLAGNETTSAVTLTLDTVPPVVSITTPLPNALLNTAQIEVAGTVSETGAAVAVNNNPAAVIGQGYTLAVLTLTEGENTITASATDRAGNRGTATVSVTLDSTPPAPPVIAAITTPTNVPVQTITGTTEAGAVVQIYSSPEQADPVLAGTVTADSQGGFSLANMALAEGTNAVIAASTDAAGNRSPDSAPVLVILDTAPPIVTVSAPAYSSFTNQDVVDLAGAVNEHAEILVNGTAATLDSLTFTQPVTLSANGSDGRNTVTISATDDAGNTSTLDWVLYLDQTPPVITIAFPADGYLTNVAQVAVSGSVNETAGSVTVNGQTATISTMNWSVANAGLSEGANTLTVSAIDRAGNVGTASVSATLDTQAPVVSVTAPAGAAAGATISLTAGATDNVGVSLVELLVNGISIWSMSPDSALADPQTVAYSIPADIADGTMLAIEARAVDSAGNTGTAAAQVGVSGGPTGPGYIQGEVYDDTSGLLLAYAEAAVSAKGSEFTRLTTGPEGGYFVEAPADSYIVSLEKPGFIPVERIIAVSPEKNSIAVDGRLTPVSAEGHLIDGNGGTFSAALSAPAVSSAATVSAELDVPAGAVNEQTDLRITPISNQGLAGLLPAGWSPIAAVDIHTSITGTAEIGEKNFAQEVLLKVPVPANPVLEPLSQVTLVHYDRTVHQWIAGTPADVGADRTFMTANLPSTGQYAFVLPDDPDGPVPQAPFGSPLMPNTTLSSLASGMTATGRVVPPVAPASANLRAAGEVVLSSGPSGTALSSGIVASAKVTERFDLLSGEVVLPSDYTQDLVLYRYPCMTNAENMAQRAGGNAGTLYSELGTLNPGKIGTSFPVTPSRQYTIVDLMSGKIGVEVSLNGNAATEGTMVGTEGARLLDTDGNVLAIPQGALTSTAPVETKTVPASALAGVVGTDFTLLRAVDVNLTGRTLLSTAELSIPASVNAAAGLPIVVARAIEIRGAKRLKLAALARITGSLITSYVPSGFSAMNGISSSGTYLFLQAKAPLGFLAGFVKDAGGNAYPSAEVVTNTCSLADLTAADGRYLVASTIANVTVTATDVYKNDTGSSAEAIAAANEVKALDVTIMATPPHVVSVSPENNATGVDPKTQIVITMSEPVLPESVTTQSVTLADSAGAAVDCVFSLNPDGTVITVYPSSNLKSETQYVLTVARSVRDLQGYVMGQDYVSLFTIKDTTPPPLPPAGSIVASFPDADGYITITATQGSAEYDGTVLVINDTSGEIVSVKPETDGSFTARIMARLGDEIKILSMDSTGNQTLITYITFKSDDGRYLVTRKGGIVEGEGGTRLEIPDGALPGPTVIKITPVTEAELPQDNPVPTEGKFLAAVNIDTGGVQFQKEVQFSVPAPSGIADGAVLFVAQPSVDVDGYGNRENVYVIKDSAKLVDTSSGKRLSTACWPFDGVLGFGLFVFLSPSDDYTPELTGGSVSVTGYTYRDMDDSGTYGGGDLPVTGAPIRCPNARKFISYSNAEGHYATYVFTSKSWGCSSAPLTATNPLTMYQATVNVNACNDIYHQDHPLDQNIKLGDANSEPKDFTAPSISINVTIADEQDSAHQDAQFIAGTVPVGTNLTVPVDVTDRSLNMVNLTVNGPSGMIQTQMTQTESAIVSSVTSTNPVTVKKFTYTAQFLDPVTGNASPYLTPDMAGTYTINVEATDMASNQSTRKVQVRVLDADSIPGSGIDGQPAADQILPLDQASDVTVAVPISVTFSEPVTNVTGTTLMLYDRGPIDSTNQTNAASSSDPVPSAVYTRIVDGKMVATLQPRNNLQYARKYEIVLTADIQDQYKNAAPLPEHMNLAERHSFFATKVPTTYGLAGADEFSGGSYGDISLYYDSMHNRTYAYVSASRNGWYVMDVSDPSMPVVTARMNTVPYTDYRHLAVDQQSGTLAITENIQTPNSQSGYIRFYNLMTHPEAPPVIGREKLSEAYSGVPGYVAISGNYAYVSTVMIGLQVVDISVAKENYETGRKSDGRSIVGVFDTLGPGYKQPRDVIIYNGSKALLTTTSGTLLVLDLATPWQPQLLSSFKPANYSAWTVGAAPEYKYIDEKGMENVIDLAMTVGMEGNIHTINMTDPYNPELMGVVKDDQGSNVTVFATDIAINKDAGLAYIAGSNAILVIDIKDPYNPKLVYTLSQYRDASGNIAPFGYSSGIVELNGWIYAANEQTGLKISNFAPPFLRLACFDPVYPKSALNCKDYYPSLGTKKIVFEGMNSGLLKFVSSTPSSPVVTVSASPDIVTSQAPFTSGRALFYLKTAPTYTGEDVLLTFQYIPDGLQLIGSSSNGTSLVAVRFKIRNNSNVTLQEVLYGKAVFTYDDICDEGHKGKTTRGDNNKREMDYVQMMINHIIPPLRTPVREQNLENTLSVDGCYGKNTKAVVEGLNGGGTFVLNQSMQNERTIALASLLMISHHLNDTNSPKTLLKLAHDYSGLDELSIAPEIGKVIDQEILVGLGNKPTDKHPQHDADIGIFELYENDDWDGDGISNYIEVENSNKITPVLSCNGFTVAPQIMGSEQGTDTVPGCDGTVYKQASVVYTELAGQNQLDPLSGSLSSTAQNLVMSTRRGTYGNGEILRKNATVDTGEYSFANRIAGLRIPSNNKGYYYYAGADVRDDVDNYALLSTLQKLERIGKKWAERHPDLAPLNTNVFPINGQGGYHPAVQNVICDDSSGGNIDLPPSDVYSNNDPLVGGIRFGVGDFSRDGGGVFYRVIKSGEKNVFEFDENDKIKKDHNSHQSGTDVDVLYMRRPACGEGGVDFRYANRMSYDRELTIELMTLFAEEGAKVFYVDQYGRDKIFDFPDPNYPGRQLKDKIMNIDFNGHIVEVNREIDHYHHFHVKFDDPYGPNHNTNVGMTIVGHENDNPLTLPTNTTVTILTDVIRDDQNWALIKGTTLGVSAKNSAGEPQGVLDSSCTQQTGYRQCNINDDGKLQFNYTTSSASGPVTVNILTKKGTAVLGTLTINIQQ